jgi:cell division septation protein DedD
MSAGEESKPAAAPPAPSPDLYAVGVRLIKMSPVWLLSVTGGFLLLTMLLGFVRPAGGDADAASVPNDAKPVAAVRAQAQAPAQTNVEVTAAVAAGQPKAAPEAQPAPPAPVAEVKPEVKPEAPAQPAPAAPVEQPKAPAKAEAKQAETGGKFTVQVGSFNSESQANERISALRASGFEARSAVVEIPGRGTWYRVHVGRFREREEAARAAAQLREKGAVSASMVVALQ